MIDEMRDYVIELVKAEYETGHMIADDFNEFKKVLADEGLRGTPKMYEFYVYCHGLGPEGFEEMYGEASEDFEEEEYIEEALNEMTNMDKLRKAFPELNQVTESALDMDKRCEECNSLLNDAGECPKCKHGEEDLDECDNLLTEDTLTEGPLDAIKNGINKVKNAFDPMTRADKSRAKADKQASNDQYKILARDFSGNGNKWIFKIKQGNKYKDYTQAEWVKMFRDAHNELKADPDSVDAQAKIAMQSNAIVVDENGQYVRRGLEDFVNNKFIFAPGKNDTIKPSYSVKVPTANEIKQAKTAQAQAERAAEDEAETSPENAAEETASEHTGEDNKQNNRYDLGISSDTYNHFLKLAYYMKPKLYDAFNKEVPLNSISDIKKISYNNLADYKIEMNGKQVDLLTWMKSAVKNKVLSEDLDDNYDDIDYDYEIEEDLDEGLSTEDMAELTSLASAIGIKDIRDLNTFVQNEVLDDESVLDALRDYKAELGDDFQVRESVEPEYDTLSEDFMSADELINIGFSEEQKDALRMMLDRASKYFQTDVENIAIFRDDNLEYDPVYFADSSKELNNRMMMFNVADMEIIKGKTMRGPVYFFRNKADADTYIRFAQAENIK